MFWSKNKKKEKPFGVQLSIDINAMTLGDVAKTSEPPSIKRMSNAWLKYNCTRISVGVAAVNGVKGSVLFFLGSDGCMYKDLDFEIKLPFPIGPNKTESVQVTPTDDFIFLSFEEVVIMAFPTSYIINSLIGEPLVEYRNAEKDMFGENSEIEINVTSPKGEYKLPVISKVAKQWFKYENTAVKVMSTLISTNDDFPLELGMSAD
jgi:hypothetical protein